MDSKDIIIIAGTMILIVVATKFMPNNPISPLINYIKTCFKTRINK